MEHNNYKILAINFGSTSTKIAVYAGEEKLLEHPELFNAPIVRNGKQATVGYCPEIWEEWLKG